MNKSSAEVPIVRIVEGKASERADTIVIETELTVYLNDHQLAKLACSPGEFDFLALGFLATEGFIASIDEIEPMIVDNNEGIVRVRTRKPFDPKHTDRQKSITSSKGMTFRSDASTSNVSKIYSTATITASQIYSLMKDFQQRSSLFKRTGGVHSAALSDGENLVNFHEDVGRHNAIDKAIGEALSRSVSLRDRFLLTSGRVPGEIVIKTARLGIPIIISKSAPTNKAVRIATELGITLVGFVRGDSLNIYARPDRVLTK